MNKIGFISDIHGNYPALKQVVKELKIKGCGRIISLGDTAGYYSMVNECVELMREEHIYSLKGNHDGYLLGESSCPRSNSAAGCIAYQRKIIRSENIKWLRTLRPVYENDEFYAVHGGLNDPIDEYITEFDFATAMKLHPDRRIFLSGHTHIQKLKHCHDVIYCNPGSVGQPRDYDRRAAYAVWEDGEMKLFRAEYNIDEIADNMKHAGFSEYYYKNLYFGCKIGEL